MPVKKKTAVLVTEDDLVVDLTLHDVPASLLAQFAEKIVKPYVGGKIIAANRKLINKAISQANNCK